MFGLARTSRLAVDRVVARCVLKPARLVPRDGPIIALVRGAFASVMMRPLSGPDTRTL